MENVVLALLGCLYLTRSGRAPISLVAEGLGVKAAKLTQVFKVLTNHKILKKGVEGFELEGHPTVGAIFQAFAPMTVLTHKERHEFSRKDTEHRAVLCLANSFEVVLAPLMKKTIRSVGNDLILLELDTMARHREGPVN